MVSYEAQNIQNKEKTTHVCSCYGKPWSYNSYNSSMGKKLGLLSKLKLFLTISL